MELSVDQREEIGRRDVRVGKEKGGEKVVKSDEEDEQDLELFVALFPQEVKEEFEVEQGRPVDDVVEEALQCLPWEVDQVVEPVESGSVHGVGTSPSGRGRIVDVGVVSGDPSEDPGGG